MRVLVAHVIWDLYHDVILCGRNLPRVCAGVLLCVGVRAAPSCVHFVTVSLSPVRASSLQCLAGAHIVWAMYQMYYLFQILCLNDTL